MPKTKGEGILSNSSRHLEGRRHYEKSQRKGNVVVKVPKTYCTVHRDPCRALSDGETDRISAAPIMWTQFGLVEISQKRLAAGTSEADGLNPGFRAREGRLVYFAPE